MYKPVSYSKEALIMSITSGNECFLGASHNLCFFAAANYLNFLDTVKGTGLYMYIVCAVDLVFCCLFQITSFITNGPC